MCFDEKNKVPAGGATDCLYDGPKVDRFANQQVYQGETGRESTDEEKLREIFTYHPPTPHSGPKFENLRAAAKHFAEVVLLNVPRGADRTCAIRHIRDAVMTANAAIALNGLSL